MKIDRGVVRDGGDRPRARFAPTGTLFVGLALASLAAAVTAAGCGGGGNMNVKVDGGGGGGGGGGATGSGGSTGGGAGGSQGGSGGGGGSTNTDGGGVVDVGAPHIAIPAPYNRALVPGGGSAGGANHKVIMTIGQSPGGGNTVKKSAKYKFVGGLIGSTQK